MTLTLRPASQLITTDQFGVEGLPFISTTIQQLPVGQTATLTWDLLEFYRPTTLLDVLMRHQGLLAMRYADDAVVSFAQLTLQTTTVPEPGTLLLVTLGLGIYGYRWRRNR
jgi:hypothetical protein